MTISEDASANLAPGRDTLAKISVLRGQTERLSSKERALMAIAHQEPDRVPIDLWVADKVKQDLLEYFGRDYERLLDELGVDFRANRSPSYVGLELQKFPDSCAGYLPRAFS